MKDNLQNCRVLRASIRKNWKIRRERQLREVTHAKTSISSVAFFFFWYGKTVGDQIGQRGSGI